MIILIVSTLHIELPEIFKAFNIYNIQNYIAFLHHHSPLLIVFGFWLYIQSISLVPYFFMSNEGDFRNKVGSNLNFGRESDTNRNIRGCVLELLIFILFCRTEKHIPRHFILVPNAFNMSIVLSIKPIKISVLKLKITSCRNLKHTPVLSINYYANKNNDVGKWLVHIFGLSFLNPEKVKQVKRTDFLSMLLSADHFICDILVTTKSDVKKLKLKKKRFE
ncbi:hypothetical protein AGLY_008943 [Aphis glycines]|uniref:Uncharacterized protein n=1 Tax=Aphis glycines TaxID=307491 RepID=A0A6G0TJ59_APHGL|nr:hypothetical protein AGLY_008943 [Aphis glycines]